MSEPKPRQELIRLRYALGLNQREMAQRIGIARNALVNAEDGDPVRLFTARKIAEYWERPIPELFPDLFELSGC